MLLHIMYISNLICMVMFDIQYLIITCFNGYMYISNYLLNNDLPCFNKLFFFCHSKSRFIKAWHPLLDFDNARLYEIFKKKKLLPGCIGKKRPQNGRSNRLLHIAHNSAVSKFPLYAKCFKTLFKTAQLIWGLLMLFAKFNIFLT